MVMLRYISFHNDDDFKINLNSMKMTISLTNNFIFSCTVLTDTLHIL